MAGRRTAEGRFTARHGAASKSKITPTPLVQRGERVSAGIGKHIPKGKFRRGETAVLQAPKGAGPDFPEMGVVRAHAWSQTSAGTAERRDGRGRFWLTLMAPTVSVVFFQASDVTGERWRDRFNWFSQSTVSRRARD